MQDDNWLKGLTNDLLRHHQCNHPMFCFYLFHAHRFPSIPLIAHGAIFSRKDHQNVQSIVASNHWDGEIQILPKGEQESGVFPGFQTAGLLSGSDKHFRKIAHKFGAFVHETVAADSNVGSSGFCDFSMSLEYMYIVECGMYHELDCGSCL